MAMSWKLVSREGRRKSYKKESRAAVTTSSTITIDAAMKLRRKQDFLSRHPQEYGYRDSCLGFIDEWRPTEFPGLQHPLGYTIIADTATGDQEGDDNEKEVYLDYAGSALPMKSQLQHICHDNSSMILANPHSTGPAASRTMHIIQKVQTHVLKHLDALPGRYASLQLPTSFYDQSTSTSSSGFGDSSRQQQQPSPLDCHAGYEVVFTSGATESCRILAERFPWQQRGGGGTTTGSIFLYVTNSHNSVVGMRQLALAQGAMFHCVDMSTLESMTVDDFGRLERRLLSESHIPVERRNTDDDSGRPQQQRRRRHLLVFPSECNFGGHRPNSANILAAAKRSGWYTLLDIAKAASTGPIHLKELDPDFAVLSFYKMFGDPTGVGGLLVKRSSISVLFEDENHHTHPRHYQGGGSVDIMISKQDYTVPKRESRTACLDALTSGTTHFRGIISLSRGFESLDRLGGMEKIQQHTTCLARELVRRLSALIHGNGTPVLQIYGAWHQYERRQIDSMNKSVLEAGPTVTFNVIRSDGSIAGYNEVSRLASLYHPPIQFRTGCFCNPGACQEALGLSDAQVIENFEKAGHVCGDHLDLVDGRPTGAIRISFGKESLWEDLDVMLQFLEGTFVDHNIPGRTDSRNIARPKSPPQTMAEVSSIFVFPIKSCAAQQVDKWQVELPSGKLRYDREFALVDTSGIALRLQTCPKLGLISPAIDVVSQTMTVSAVGYKDLIIHLNHDQYHGGENGVQVCGNKCGGKLWGDASVSEWFSDFLGVQCWLARYSGNQSSPTPDSAKKSRAGFSNEQPILLVSEHAVEALNTVLEEQGHKAVDSKRFRPNIVVKTAEEMVAGHSYDHHIEDNWEVLSLIKQNFTFKVEGPCPRCTMVDYDPVTGRKGRTLRALAKYRRRNGSIVFGIFLKAKGTPLNDDAAVWIERGDLLKCR